MYNSFHYPPWLSTYFTASLCRCGPHTHSKAILLHHAPRETGALSFQNLALPSTLAATTLSPPLPSAVVTTA